MQKIFKWNVLVLLISIVIMLNMSTFSIKDEVTQGIQKEISILDIGVKRKDFMTEIGKPIDSW